MAVVATALDLLNLIVRAGLADEPTLDAALERIRQRTVLPEDPETLARYLVKLEVLTAFQAGLLLQGRWKGLILDGKYRIRELLGKGGMGCVYLCEHLHMHRQVAVKVLPTRSKQDPVAVQRFLREARVIAGTNHPNFVRGFDVNFTERDCYIVMEYIKGTSFQTLVEREGRLSIERACDLIAQTANGLQHAFERGMIHRDIKPSNLLIDAGGVVKILDFGLAKLLADTTDQLTRELDSTKILGTADYASPEQAMNAPTIDIRSDIYSLGATFYFLLTASPLFPGGSMMQKLMQHQVAPPPSVLLRRPDVPQAIADLLQQMLAKNPADRPPTPARIIAHLQPFLSPNPVGPPTAEPRLPQISARLSGSTLPVIPLTLPPRPNDSSDAAIAIGTGGSTVKLKHTVADHSEAPRPAPFAESTPNSVAPSKSRLASTSRLRIGILIGLVLVLLMGAVVLGRAPAIGSP